MANEVRNPGHWKTGADRVFFRDGRNLAVHDREPLTSFDEVNEVADENRLAAENEGSFPALSDFLNGSRTREFALTEFLALHFTDVSSDSFIEKTNDGSIGGAPIELNDYFTYVLTRGVDGRRSRSPDRVEEDTVQPGEDRRPIDPTRAASRIDFWRPLRGLHGH